MKYFYTALAALSLICGVLLLCVALGMFLSENSVQGLFLGLLGASGLVCFVSCWFCAAKVDEIAESEQVLWVVGF